MKTETKLSLTLKDLFEVLFAEGLVQENQDAIYSLSIGKDNAWISWRLEALLEQPEPVIEITVLETK